ncbi:MAG: alpha/beta hydrolase [Thiomargarita sp.]|nr:alpha/beta hydrolase [Thiomargarita sp.]
MIKKMLQSVLRIIIGVFVAIPSLLYPFLYFSQERLLFIQQDMADTQLSWIQNTYPHTEEIQIMTPDHVRLQGWYIKNGSEQPAPLIIYFGGNSEEISSHIRDSNYLNNWSLLLVNYRGYGLSEGEPSEQNFFNDAVLLYDTFSKRTDINANRIVAFGRSLGTGVAVYLASKRPKLSGVILVSPYDSIQNLAQKVYPYVPVSLLLKHPFDVISLAPSIKSPLFALIAQHDSVIPSSNSLALIKAWGGVTHQQLIPNTNHHNISMSDMYWTYIMDFLNSVK